MPNATYEKRWEIIETLGEGGQGKVHKVVRTEDGLSHNELMDKTLQAFDMLTSRNLNEHQQGFEDFFRTVKNIIRTDDPKSYAALKVLHDPQHARDADLAEKRMQREIKVMWALEHPNLLRIIDSDPENYWFVSQYHPRGTLDQGSPFKGDLRAALMAIRPLVDGVALLHEREFVHRDIKPQNIFIGEQGELVLGDFGLIFFADAGHTRISGTFENVGSKDWMPAWALQMRIDEVTPSFDVFGLAKTIWAMVSGKPGFPLWYYDDPRNDLVEQFPEASEMKLANRLFSLCLVEKARQCRLPTARDLLAEIDRALAAMKGDADILGDQIKRRCRVCGTGTYELVVNQNATGIRNFLGSPPVGMRSFKIFTCSHCGHVQMFEFNNDRKRPAWDEA